MTNHSRHESAKRKSRLFQAQQDFQEALHEEDALLPSRWDAQQWEDIPVDSAGAVVMCRSSNPEQDLSLQVRTTKRLLAEKNCPITKLFAGVEKGWRLDEEGRPVLFAAMSFARRHNLPLIYPDFTRLLRNQVHMERPSLNALKEMSTLLKGISHGSLNDVDAHPASGEAFLRKEYSITEGRRVGRPSKQKERREDRKGMFLPEAIRLRKQGKSLREITRIINPRCNPPVSVMGLKIWLDSAGEL